MERFFNIELRDQVKKIRLNHCWYGMQVMANSLMMSVYWIPVDAKRDD